MPSRIEKRLLAIDHIAGTDEWGTYCRKRSRAKEDRRQFAILLSQVLFFTTVLVFEVAVIVHELGLLGTAGFFGFVTCVVFVKAIICR